MMMLSTSTEASSAVNSSAAPSVNPVASVSSSSQEATAQTASATRMMQIRASASPFLRYMEELEDLVLNGTSIPLTHMTLVNSEHVIPLMDNIRESLPQEILQSQRILDVRDQMLQEASEQAARTIEQAQLQARTMVSESELLRAIYHEAESLRQQVHHETEQLRHALYQEANNLRQQALQEAGVVRTEVEQYVNQVLHSLDETFSQYHTILSNTQSQLNHIRPLFAGQPPTSLPATGMTAALGTSPDAPSSYALPQSVVNQSTTITPSTTPSTSHYSQTLSEEMLLPQMQASLPYQDTVLETPTTEGTQEGLTPSGLPPYHVIQQALKENPHIPPKKVLEVLLQNYQTVQNENHKRSALETILAKDKIVLPQANQAIYATSPQGHGGVNHDRKSPLPKHKVSAKQVTQKYQKLSHQYR